MMISSIRKSLAMCSTLALASLCSINASAGFRIQHYAPELRWMTQPPVEEAKVEAAILAPRGLSCYLPSADGYCTIPLFWLTNQGDPASLWRELNGNRIKVAQGYDGQINATVRLNQQPLYQVIKGSSSTGQVLDAAVLNAIWDPSVNPEDQKIGEITLQNEGDCQILTDKSYCEVELSWTTRNVQSASLWQRSPNGLVSVFEGAKEAALKVAAYDHSTIYELREGTAPTGDLLAGAMTKGHRVEVTGSLALPDGTTCNLAPGQKTCQVRVSWETNDIGRLWMREQAMSSVAQAGQSLVTIKAEGGIVDLRVGGTASGAILDRASLSTVAVDNSGSITSLSGDSCEIPYSGTNCEQTLQFSVDKGVGTLWDENNRTLGSGISKEVVVTATEYGQVYHLRSGTEIDGQILSTYIAKGIRQTYRGSIKPTTTDTCTFDYQGGKCQVSVDYEATDNSSIWETSKASVVAGGQKSGTVNLTLNDYTGEDESLLNFELKIHGNYSPKLSDPTLGAVVLKGVQPVHTGQLTAVAGTSCNLLYSKDSCALSLKSVTTAPAVTLWDDQTGKSVWYGGNGTNTMSLNVAEGTYSYTLREGTKITNKAFGSINLTGVRPSYYAQLTMPSGTSCTVAESNAACTLSFKLNSNTATRVRYRDITTTPSAPWTTSNTNLAANASLTFSAANVTANRTYEFQVEQNASPNEPLDIITATALINEPHTFELTSTLPQPGNGLQCGSQWSAVPGQSACLNSTPITWNTSASYVSACRRAVGADSYICLRTTSKKVDFGGYWSQADVEHIIDFYEGNVSPPSRSEAEKAGYRLLESRAYVPARMMSPAEMDFKVNLGTYQCSYTDQDDEDCTQYVPVTYTLPYDAINQSNSSTNFTLYYYLARKGSASTSSILSGAGSKGANISIHKNDPTFEWELRIRGGSVASLSDPVVGSFVVAPVYTDITGIVMLKRVNDSIASQSTFTNSAIYPYYFSRAYDNATGKFGDVAEDCLIQHNESECKVYTYISVTAGSRGSLFVDGVYRSNFSSGLNLYALSLSEGVHDIAIYDGTNAGAINNKKIDGFKIRVRRPSYTGSLVADSNDVALSYYGEKQSVNLRFNINTRAYVYNTDTNTMLQGTAPNYGADVKFRLSSSIGSGALGAGVHNFELRTHPDKNDPANIVLATEQIRLTHKVQTMQIRASSSYQESFSSCRISYQPKYCNIYYEYVNSHASSSGIVACVVSPTGIRKNNEINGATSYASASVRAYLGDSEVRFYNGKNCPSTVANTEGYPLLLIHPIAIDDYAVGADIVPRNGANVVYADNTEAKKWYCRQKYQGDNCNITLGVFATIKETLGQPINAYYGAYISNSNDLLYPANTYNDYSFGLSIGTTAGGIYQYDVYACSNTNSSAANCPKDKSHYVNSAYVEIVLPEYTAALSTPKGDTCMGSYAATTCLIELNVTTDSSLVTIYRDGVVIDTLTSKAMTKSYNIPVKAKGQSTAIVVRDGSSASNRVLATLDVVAEVYDPAIFKFTSPMNSGDVLTTKSCVVSHLMRYPDCNISIDYESDNTLKYLVSNSAGSISPTEVSNDGSITFTSSNYIPTVPIFAGSGSTYNSGQIDAYLDSSKKSLAARVKIPFTMVKYSDDVFGAPSQVTVARNNPSFYSNYCGRYCGYYYYIENNSQTLSIDSTFAIDDITFTYPASLCGTQTTKNYQRFCAYIDYMYMYKSVASGAQLTSVVPVTAGNTVKRIYYKLNSTNFSDPAITINGVVRPLQTDGNWHYLDVNLKDLGSVTVSAINDLTTAQTFSLYLFAEYYTTID